MKSWCEIPYQTDHLHANVTFDAFSLMTTNEMVSHIKIYQAALQCRCWYYLHFLIILFSKALLGNKFNIYLPEVFTFKGNLVYLHLLKKIHACTPVPKKSVLKKSQLSRPQTTWEPSMRFLKWNIAEYCWLFIYLQSSFRY